jgi:hypothetical protein
MISHVSGKSNPADLFTKEMQDGAHFHRLQDSFMHQSSDLLKGIHTLTLPLPEITHIAQSAHYIMPPAPEFLTFFSPTNPSTCQRHFLASPMQDDTFSHTSVYYTGSYEQSHGGYGCMILIPVIALLDLAS